MERGFIRAEVVSYVDFMTHGGNMKACRDAGVLRLEGKEYVVADGDIINFRFNV
jgi:ribosome-binding ATPase YchF (GTP1/OBG family)